MKLLNYGKLGFMLLFPFISQAATIFPTCFKMENDSLNRIYSVAKNTNDPLASITTKDSIALNIFEYYATPTYPKKITLQTSYQGVGKLNTYSELEQVLGGTVTGADIGSNEVTTLQIEKDVTFANWLVKRSTFTGSVTTHNLVQIDCINVTR